MLTPPCHRLRWNVGSLIWGMTLVLMITQQPYTVAPRRSLSLAQCSTLAIASYHLHRLSRLGGYPLYRTLTSLLGKAAEVSSQVYCRPDSQI